MTWDDDQSSDSESDGYSSYYSSEELSSSSVDELDLSSSINESMRISILRQRGLTTHQAPDTIPDEKCNKNKAQRSWPKRIRAPRRLRNIRSVYREDTAMFCSTVASILLCASIFVWILFSFVPYLDDYLTPSGTTVKRAKNRLIQLRGDAGLKGFSRSPRQGRKKSKEALPNGCERPSWQELNYPNCNSLHEIAVDEAVWEQIKTGRGGGRPVGVLDNGMWRDVLAVYPNRYTTNPIVLKMMKAEHTVDTRNFDRHRRDALVMERLTASPYIVDIYGFCGNNMLTEFIGSNLEHVITRKKDNLPASRKTPLERVRLAFDSALALKAIHEIQGGPIIHADIQAKQFLVTPDGRVKLNDFNRCRFMAQSVRSGGTCSLHIPSAPGKFRAPEEYELAPLDEKLDIYSLGHVMFGILTGKIEPWGRYGTEQTKRYVKKGSLPTIPKPARMASDADEELAELIEKAYTLKASDRISASNIASSLKDLLDRM